MHLLRCLKILTLAAGLAVTGPLLAGSIAPALQQAVDQAAVDELLPVVILMEQFPRQSELLSQARTVHGSRILDPDNLAGCGCHGCLRPVLLPGCCREWRGDRVTAYRSPIDRPGDDRIDFRHVAGIGIFPQAQGDR